MARKVAEGDLREVLKAVALHASGASTDEIAKKLQVPMPRRTLQRRLSLLLEHGRLAVTGTGSGRRYSIPGKTPEAVPAKSEPLIPTSPEGEEIRKAVRKPIQNRPPVGYNRAWLDTYRPNHTFYLPETIRQRLAELGRFSEGEVPAGTYAQQLFSRLLIDLSWNSSRLEGNTYSLLETERLIHWGESAEGKDIRDAQMILNHKRAIELLVEQASEINFNRYTILNLHAILSENLLSDPQASGRIRTIPVGVGGTVFEPLAVPQLIQECFDQILDTAAAIRDPFEQSFFAMVHLPYLQPFEDVNKRVSRLAANIPLIRSLPAFVRRCAEVGVH